MLARRLGMRLGTTVATFVLGLVALASGPVTNPPAAAAAYCDDYPFLCATITVTLDGTGTGTVASADGKISCHRGAGATSGTCSARYVTSPTAATISLTITPAPGSEGCRYFQGCWTEPETIEVTFAFDTTWAVTFDVKGYTAEGHISGPGDVILTPPSDNCGITCYFGFGYGTVVEVAPQPDPGAVLLSWSGACAGAGAVCQLTMTADRLFGATFGAAPTAGPTPAPSPSKAPTAAPTGATRTASPGATAAPGASGSAGASPSPPGNGPTVDPSAAVGPSLPASLAPTIPAASPDSGGVSSPGGAQPDLTVLVLAILGAGLLIGVGLFAGLVLRRREAPREVPPPG